MKRLALVALVFVFSTPGWAAVYTVDPSNPQAADTNNGTQTPLKTISAAAALAQPGDTIRIGGGTYRETVTLKNKGLPGKPIRLEAAPGQRAILSGADVLQGWKKATAADVGNHPNAERLFVIDLSFTPTRLLESSRPLAIARTPAAGWWAITEGLSLSEFTDTRNLTQKSADAWDGWTVALLEQAGGGVAHVPVKSFDPATHKITLTRDYSRYRKKIDHTRDRYYMENHLSALSGPGQYVIRAGEGKGCRIILWPTKLNDEKLPVIEAPARSMGISIVNQSNLVIDGLEVCFSANHGIGMSTGGAPSNITIQNCYIHDNESYGVEMRQPVACTIRRNNIHRNSNGVVLGGSKDCVIEENDIGWNSGDGVDAPNGTRNLIIQRNYIHDHYLWGHPDSIQFWTDVEGTVIRDNVFINAGQNMMSEGMKNTKIINNLYIGSHAVSMIAGGDGWEISHNTICAAAPTPTNFYGKNFTLTNNIIAPLHEGPLYMMSDPDSFKADYNLLWGGPDYTKALVVKGAWKDVASSLDEIRTKFGQEKHGLVGDPKFRNVPKFFATTDYARVAYCTAGTFTLRFDPSRSFAIGDIVELDFDGVGRKVSAVAKDSITVTPALAAPPVTVQSVANWGKLPGDRPNITWDLRLSDESPARKAAATGADIGCSVDLQAYQKGDFNNDGKRELPEVPKE